MARWALVLSSLMVVLGIISTGVASAEGEGKVALSSSELVIGGTEPLAVQGSGFSGCAGQHVVLSLLFRSTTNTGYSTFEDATRYSEVSVPVDAAGSFSASLKAPTEFPGWLGYLAMQGDCVTLAPQRLLARLQAVVPLESQLARSLGLPQVASAVVIPAAEVRALPILPDDPVKDPYLKLNEIGLNSGPGAVCGSADASRARTASGDVVIDASRCGASSLAVSVARGTVLESRATLREGYAVPLALAFPPPGTGGPESPLAPNTGTAGSAPPANPAPGPGTKVPFLAIAAGSILVLVAIGGLSWKVVRRG